MATNPDVAMEKARRRFLMVWTAVGAILLTGAAVYLINILSVPIGILLWTLVIVFCLRGTVNKLESKGVPRPAGTGIAYLLMFAVLAIVSFLMLSPAFGFGEQFTDLVQSIPGYINDFMGWANGVYARYSDVFQNNTVQAYMNEALSSMGSAASDVARQSATGVVAIGAGVVNTGIAVGFALVIAFWILIELPALGRETMRLAGPSHRETMDMLHVTFTRVMGGRRAVRRLGHSQLRCTRHHRGHFEHHSYCGPVARRCAGGACGRVRQPVDRPGGACGHHHHPAGGVYVRLSEDHGVIG